MWLYQIGRVITERRLSLGLSSSLLAKLASVEEVHIVALENGELEDISYMSLCRTMAIVGLAFDVPTPDARSAKCGLDMAARNSSVSYKQELDGESLKEILKSARVPDQYRSTMIHFFDETPLPLVVMAAEEASRELDSPTIIWENLRQLALVLDSSRKDVWC